AAKMFEVLAALLLVRQDEFGADARHAIGEKFEPLFERFTHGRRVENDVADLLPVVALFLPADDAHGLLKCLALDPKLAIERRFRQPAEEPVGGVEFVPQPRDEALSVPVGAHSVELLAHPPSGEVDVVLPDMGQEQWRSLALVPLV